jgi:hypothetical protein
VTSRPGARDAARELIIASLERLINRTSATASQGRQEQPG